jgi:hypothetical protein
VKRLVVILFVMLMATVLGWIWVYGASGDTACIELYPDLPEGTAFQQTEELWPPGTKCVYELPDGREERRSRFP